MEEYIRQEVGCARIDTVRLNRERQIQSKVVKNLSGPLDRSSFYEDKPAEQVPKDEALFGERIRSLSQAIGVIDSEDSIPDRLKMLEEGLIQLERDYPSYLAFQRSIQTVSKDSVYKLE